MLNISKDLKAEQLSLANLNLTSGPVAEILSRIDFIHHLLMKVGIPTRAYTPKSISILGNMEERKQLEVLASLNRWTEILSEVDSEKFEYDEATLAKKALGLFNFRLRDFTWDTTAKQQIIEIYNYEGMQLYRSLNFFETCGYSLLDLCVIEWFVLWERPRKVLDDLNKVAADILTGKLPKAAFTVPPHIIRETYDDGTTQPFLPRSLLVTLKNIYPAFGPNNNITGFVCTSTCEVLSVGDDALKIGFI